MKIWFLTCYDCTYEQWFSVGVFVSREEAEVMIEVLKDSYNSHGNAERRFRFEMKEEVLGEVFSGTRWLFRL